MLIYYLSLLRVCPLSIYLTTVRKELHMNKTKIFYIALSLFLGSCLGSLANAEDEYTPLWEFEFENGRIDEAAYVPQLRFTNQGRPIAESGIVIVGATEAENTIGQHTNIQLIGLEATTGQVSWRDWIQLTSGNGAGGQVLSITPILLRDDEWHESRAVVVYIDKLKPGVANSVIFNVETGGTLGIGSEEDPIKENVINKLYFKPIDGDFDGDGRINNFLIRKNRSLIQARD